MKLDRNVNPDGRGKYALINLRTNQVQWGGDDQFFVIKYKDKFAAPALRAYAVAVNREIVRLHALTLTDTPPHMLNPVPVDVEAYRIRLREQIDDLMEYATEIAVEAELAEHWPNKTLPS